MQPYSELAAPRIAWLLDRCGTGDVRDAFSVIRVRSQKNRPMLGMNCMCDNFALLKSMRPLCVGAVLDLDETLVHASLRACEPHDLELELLDERRRPVLHHIMKRPHLHTFLDQV